MVILRNARGGKTGSEANLLKRRRSDEDAIRVRQIKSASEKSQRLKEWRWWEKRSRSATETMGESRAENKNLSLVDGCCKKKVTNAKANTPHGPQS